MSARLTVHEAAAGAHAAYRNALDLLHDAIHLYNANRYARAVALFILAIEEASKPAIFACIAATDDEEKREEFWQQLKSHRARTCPARSPSPCKSWPSSSARRCRPTTGWRLYGRRAEGARPVEARCALLQARTARVVGGSRKEKVRFLFAMRLSEIAASCVAAAELNPVLHEQGMTLFVRHIGPALRANAGFREADLAYRKAVIDAKLAPEGGPTRASIPGSVGAARALACRQRGSRAG
ncbi:MAG: AbiV family abortive infection protein [Planctomycetota bacterium]